MSRAFYGGASVNEASRANGYVSFDVPSVAEQPVDSEDLTAYNDAVEADMWRTRRRTFVGIAAAVGAGTLLGAGYLGSEQPNQPQQPPAIVVKHDTNNPYGPLPLPAAPNGYGAADISQFTGGW